MLQSLRDAACPGAAALTGMPHTPGIKDKVGDLAAEIVDMDAARIDKVLVSMKPAANGEPA